MIRSYLISAFLLFGTLSNLAWCQENCDVDQVCFAVDQSGSIENIYTDIQDFVADAATRISQVTNAVYSGVGFSDSFSIIQAPTTDVTVFGNSVRNAPASFGGTNMYAGVNQCYNYVENEPGRRVIVLITDGQDGSVPSALDLVLSKAATNVVVVAVGIGNRVVVPYLESLSSEYIPANRSNVDAIADLLERGICEAPPPGQPCENASDLCDFKFSGFSGVPTFSISGKQDKAFTSKIVSKSGPRIGVLNANGITPEFINETDGTTSSITSFGNPKLTPTHFKPFSIPRSAASGIGHQTFTGNQLQISRDRCVRVFFSSYQTLTLGLKPRVINNVNVEKSDNKCVVFRTA